MVGLAVGAVLCGGANGAGLAAASGLAAGLSFALASRQRGKPLGGRGREDSRRDRAGEVAAQARVVG